MQAPIAPGQIVKARIPRFAHNALAWSPFYEDRIAVGSGANFGLIGNGRVHILQLGPQGLGVVKWFDTQDNVYDVAWNEAHENQVIAACGNGALKLFDTTLEGLPVRSWHEHSAEIMSVDWNNLVKTQFATASWDTTVKVWDLARATALATFAFHKDQAYAARFSPRMPSLLVSGGADASIALYDLRQSASSPVDAFQTTGEDILDLDWNKYQDGLVATANKKGDIRLYDMRMMSRRNDQTKQLQPGQSVGALNGHRLAVRKVAWSPHSRDVLASTSYDMTCRTWSTSSLQEQTCHSQHTEFVMGTAWALFDQGLLGTCAWDQEVHLYRA